MKFNPVSAVFNLYAAPFKLLNVFMNRCQKDIAPINDSVAKHGFASFKSALTEHSDNFQSYAQNARCLSIIAMASFALPVFMATQAAAAPIATAAIVYTGVCFAAKNALKVEDKYQASFKTPSLS